MQSRLGGQRRALDSPNWRARPDNSPPDAKTGSARPANYAVNSYQNNFDDNSVPQAPPTNSDSDNPSNPHLDDGDNATAAAIAAGRRIYVGNLPYHVRPRDVEELFGEAAKGGPYEITLLAMSVDPFTGRNPSYCFVELADRSQAESAMAQLNGTMLLGRPVRIKPCIPRTTERRKEWEESMLPSRWERTDAEKHFRGVGAQGRRLYIGGLSRPLNQPDSEKRIRELFYGFNVDAISKVVSQPGNNYFAFVDMPTVKEADRAILTLNGKAVRGGRLRVSRVKGDSWKVDERDCAEDVESWNIRSSASFGLGHE